MSTSERKITIAIGLSAVAIGVVVGVVGFRRPSGMRVREKTRAAEEACSVAAVRSQHGDARLAATWGPYSGCGFKAGVVGTPTFATTDAEVRALFDCPPSKLPPNLDDVEREHLALDREQIVRVTRVDRENGHGMLLLDDGKVLTLVDMVQPPCPGEKPEKVGAPWAFGAKLPDRAPRSFATDTCTEPSVCP